MTWVWSILTVCIYGIMIIGVTQLVNIIVDTVTDALDALTYRTTRDSFINLLIGVSLCTFMVAVYLVHHFKLYIIGG